MLDVHRLLNVRVGQQKRREIPMGRRGVDRHVSALPGNPLIGGRVR